LFIQFSATALAGSLPAGAAASSAVSAVAPLVRAVIRHVLPLGAGQDVIRLMTAAANVLAIRRDAASRRTVVVPGRTEGGMAMSVRRKLNGAHATGALLLAGLLGLVTGSAGVFLVSFGGLLAADLVAGNIRPKRR
jgi:hypothetical protein